ncbi:hypothetical protein BDK89_3821 [Ilumatobacter fluminis]|uniref:Uncharacterized protein n=1 Tax=Ilumatobacter fluminis TaxID=467091 RepID=A0A4R7I4M2_9ACTN|nr:hypothetical protein [Ilumatobacter fluminis]TDT18204.1 hypothetical protein BDK89_3821 [Ilumatobacter fluminis]
MRNDTTSTELGDEAAAWSALAELYHRYLTGLLLGMVTRIGTAPAAEVVFRLFRNQHLEAFHPGLEKLGLTDEPDAVACAKYHVLSNALGGVRVEWIPESDTKSWVRYLPPRWIFDGTAVCGIPTELSRAMLRGWHGHNGVSLGNDRLGFVATSQTTDGQPGLVGYYIEETEPLSPEDRVRFRPGEQPPGPAATLPTPSWDPVRLAKVERNYAMNYIHTILPAMTEVLGPAETRSVAVVVGHQIGMQFHQSVMATLGDDRSFEERFGRLLDAHGPTCDVTGAPSPTVRLSQWRLFDPATVHPVVFDGWNALWEGLAAMEDRRLVVRRRLDLGDDAFEWEVRASSALG